MDPSSLNESRETGKKVWESIMGQMAEGRGFLSAMFSSFRIFVKNNILLLLVFGIIGAIATGLFWYLKPGVYKAEMTVSYVHYEKKIYADMLEKLDGLVQAGSYASIAGLLGMQEEDAMRIQCIKAYNIHREILTEDISTQKVPFYVVVGVTSNEILPQLQYALVNYLNGTDFIKARLDFNMASYKEELQFLQNRLASLDSLKSNLLSGKTVFGEEDIIKGIEMLENKTFEIHERIQEVNGALAFNGNIEVLDGFIANNKAGGKSIFLYLLYGFLAGVGIRLIIMILR